jgi:hypothetical protein
VKNNSGTIHLDSGKYNDCISVKGPEIMEMGVLIAMKMNK